MAMSKYVLGVFDDEDKMMTAAKSVRESGAKIHDVYTPHPVHGIDEIIGIRRSRLPVVTFFAGLVGCSVATFFQIWVFFTNWPMDVGGKPLLAIPAYVPVSFEFTILIGGLSTVLALFIRTKLFPGQKKTMLDLRVTDDRFVIAVPADSGVDKIKGLLTSGGAVEVKETDARL